MEQRLSFVTLAVQDLPRARSFYVEGLGWTPSFENDQVVMMPVGPNVVLSLLGADAFADEIGPTTLGTGIAPFTLAHNVASRDGVASVLASAEAAGGSIVQPGTDRDWGGHSGYFADPDGTRWEVACWDDPSLDPTLPAGTE